MSTTIEIAKLQPLGTKVLVKRKPADERVKSILIPADLVDRNTVKGDLFCGVAIAVGPRTKSAKYGRDRNWFEPGDTVWLWHLYDWADKKMVLQDETSGDEYLIIDESDIRAFELPENNESN